MSIVIFSSSDQNDLTYAAVLIFCCFFFCCSVSKSCPALCNPMNCILPGFPVLHHLPELTQTCVHRVDDVIKASHPLSSPSPAFNLSQHQGLFQRVNSLHQPAKVLELELELHHQSFQCIFRIDFLQD